MVDGTRDVTRPNSIIIKPNDWFSIGERRARLEGEPLTTQPYSVASLRIPAGAKVLELPRQKLLNLVMEVIETEGPVHQDEIARRIVDSCGQRMGSKIP